jgi:hypothetical protein
MPELPHPRRVSLKRGGDGTVSWPTYSPDGRAIAFDEEVCDEVVCRFDIATVTANGSDHHRLVLLESGTRRSFSSLVAGRSVPRVLVRDVTV